MNWFKDIFFKSKKRKSYDEQESTALNNLLSFLNIGYDQGNMAEITYFTCMKVLSEGIAKLPLALQKVTEEGGIVDMSGHKLWQTVKVRPNPYMSPSNFWTTVENCRNHYGNSYVHIDRSTDKGVRLWPLDPVCMRLEIGNLRELSELPDIYYRYTDPQSGETHRYSSDEILHFKTSATFGGLLGLSVQEKLRLSLHGAYKSQEMLNELYDNHFVPKAVVQFGGAAEVNEELQKKYLTQLQNYVDGKMEGTRSFLPISWGSSIVPLNIRLTDGQFLELRQYTALQIASAFGIKPNHLNDYTKSSYANSETQQLAFYTDTMLFIIKQYEEELNYKLLSDEQREEGYRFKFNIAAVLRGDTKSQVDSLSNGIASGLYTPNEARRNIDLPNVPGGDRIYFNGSNIPVELAGIQYGDRELPEAKAILRLAAVIENAVNKRVDFIQNPETGLMEGSRPSGNTGSPGRENISSEAVANEQNGGIIEEKEVSKMSINSIDMPIEQRNTGKGNPNAILTFGIELNSRQKHLLEALTEFDSRVTVPKKSVRMSDLSALTAYTGDEFAMFTKGGERLIIRGNAQSVNIDVEAAKQMAKQGYRWSGHTHPGISFNCLFSSDGDRLILEQFKQDTSVIYNSKGQFLTFALKE